MKHATFGSTMLTRYGALMLMAYLIFLTYVAVIGGDINESQRWLAYLFGGIAAGAHANLRAKRFLEKRHDESEDFDSVGFGDADVRAPGSNGRPHGPQV